MTLIDLLCCLAIIGILISLLIPAVQSARDAANRTRCANNLRQIGVGFHNYHALYGVLPPKKVAEESWLQSPEALCGWPVLLAPMLEHEAIYRDAVEACRIEFNTIKNPPHTHLTTVMPVLVCPNDARLKEPKTGPDGVLLSFSSYLGNAGGYNPDTKRGLRGVLGTVQGIPFAEISDGLSNTILVGERPPPGNLIAGRWYPVSISNRPDFGGPNNIMIVSLYDRPDNPCALSGRAFGPGRLDRPCDRYHYWSLHRGGANFLFGDSAVRFIPYSANKLLYPLLSRDSGDHAEIP